MKTEEIIDRLRNPQKYTQKADVSQTNRQTVAPATSKEPHRFNNLIGLVSVLCVIGTAGIVFIAMMNAKNRAENISAALDPTNLQGLVTQEEFNPYKNVTYVQIYEGQDRNVSVEELGTTLPIINRFNYQSMTPNNYSIIGMAPYALSQNLAANLQDADLLRYLLNREEVGKAFIKRADVAPLLEDPQLLAAFAQDTKYLNEFFNQEFVQQILASPSLVSAMSESKFMGYLLASKAVKYYRNHPREAATLIHANPVLQNLKANTLIRQAIQKNTYLKPIANELLATPPNPSKTTAKK